MLVISLDFELIWGAFDHFDLRQASSYFQSTQKIIPLILDLFTDYDVAASWATVGMVFHNDWEDWEMFCISSLVASS